MVSTTMLISPANVCSARLDNDICNLLDESEYACWKAPVARMAHTVFMKNGVAFLTLHLRKHMILQFRGARITSLRCGLLVTDVKQYKSLQSTTCS